MKDIVMVVIGLIIGIFIGILISKNNTPKLVGTYQYVSSNGSSDTVVILDKENALYKGDKATYKVKDNQIEITYQTNSIKKTEGPAAFEITGKAESTIVFNIVPNGLIKDTTDWLFKKVE